MSTPRRALLSVSDKTGIVELGRALVERGWQLLSTGGTAGTLRDAGLPVTDVSEITGHPEMLDGRVKTLHPAVHAGLLARRERADDMEALAAHGYGAIDLVAVNLYPFRETVAAGSVPVAKAMEKVDIGGPTMIRAAAKSHRHVWVVVDPADYGRVLEAVELDGEGADLRRELAAKVFRHMSGYDGAIADYLEGQEGAASSASELGERFRLSLRRKQPLRYGENPDQQAAFYWYPGEPAGLSALHQLQGKELSYNNYLDLDGALLALAPFAFSPRPAVAIVKHTTPCGLAVADTLAEAYGKALRTDPVSAYGSVIAVNRPVDGDTGAAMAELFVECIVAPRFDPAALDALGKKKNLRLLTYPGIGGAVEREPRGGAWTGLSADAQAAGRFLAEHGRRPLAFSYRSVYGGVLVQSPPVPPFYGDEPAGGWKVVSRRPPDAREAADLRFAWAAVYSVKSNAILLARDGATLGIGAGQMSRVDSSRTAVQKAADAKLPLRGAVLASDAFFPFRDGVDAAAEAGVTAIIQPGGSVRDEEVIDAANEHRVAMVFTGRRLFRH